LGLLSVVCAVDLTLMANKNQRPSDIGFGPNAVVESKSSGKAHLDGTFKNLAVNPMSPFYKPPAQALSPRSQAREDPPPVLNVQYNPPELVGSLNMCEATKRDDWIDEWGNVQKADVQPDLVDLFPEIEPYDTGKTVFASFGCLDPEVDAALLQDSPRSAARTPCTLSSVETPTETPLCSSTVDPELAAR